MASRPDDVIRHVRQTNVSVAAVFIDGRIAQVRVRAGAGPATEDTLFEVGSVTKTITALLLAQMVLAGEATLDTPLGESLPVGDNYGITLGQLATHTSGLPRLPENLMAKAHATPHDPYSSYDADDLLADLRAHPVSAGAPEYSNYGYMALGLALSTIGGDALSRLLTDRVFGPLGMTSATLEAGLEAPSRRAQGYVNNEPVPHWSKLLPGAGGIEASINDIASYLRAQLDPSTGGDLQVAIEMTQRPIAPYEQCLGWQRAGSIRWHNGGTGGFSAFVGFDRAAGKAVGVLSSMGNASTLVDGAGFRALDVDNPLLG